MATLGNFCKVLFPKFQPNKSIVFQKFIRGSCCPYATNAGKSAAMMMNENQRNRTWATKRQQAVSQDKNWQDKRKRRRHWMVKNPSRAMKMRVETTDWPSVFAAPRSYNPFVIPVALRMGRLKHNRMKNLPQRPIGNLELMKVPNFFHLAPPTIKRQCDALKSLCKPWPSDLEAGKRPLQVTTRNYLFAGPSLYHPGSRKVKLRVYLKDLVLDEHARKKLIALVGPRYDAERDSLTLVTDRCPTRKQNKDYAIYILTVLYHEAWKTEPWELDENKQENESDEEEEPRKRRKNKKPLRLIGDELYRVNQYGKAFKLKIKVKT